MKHLSVNLKEVDGEIIGKIYLPDDAAFVLECLAELVQRFSTKCDVQVNEVLQDIQRLAK